MSKLPKLIIDTDPGHDDAAALMMLALSKKFDILAVTTVAGNSTIDHTTTNARYALNLVGATDIPVYSGASQPIKRPPVLADVHGDNGLAGADITSTTPLTNNAPEKIAELVRANSHEVTILALGPLTNIAKSFLNDPELPDLTKQVVMMGGAIEVPGNKNRVAEFNIFVDPDAADIIFRSNARKTLVPLDPCNNISFHLEEFRPLEGAPFYPVFREMMSEFIERIHQFEKTSGALLYDGIAAYYLMNPDAFKTMPMDIIIETQGEATLGMTVADRRTWGLDQPNTTVITHMDEEVFKKDLLAVLGSMSSAPQSRI